MHLDKQKFSILKRAQSFENAGRGLIVFFKGTHNAWVHIVALALAIILGFHFSITKLEWIIVILCSGIVLAAEAVNTAIEIDIDLTSPEFHPFARDTKDVAAAAVLIVSIAALIAGMIIFIPYILASL